MSTTLLNFQPMTTTPKKRRKPKVPVYTQPQERIIHRIATKVFAEQFKGKGREPQVKMGLALGLSQRSISLLLNGEYTPGPAYAANLATLAGYESLIDMIGPFKGAPTEEDVPESTRTAFANLRKCIEYHEANRWEPWTIAAASKGLFSGEDVSPAQWEKRLDELEAQLKKVHKAK